MGSNIRAMIADVEVEDLEAAIPLYRELAGDVDVKRFPYLDLQLAAVGPFLLHSGPPDKYVSQTATVGGDHPPNGLAVPHGRYAHPTDHSNAKGGTQWMQHGPWSWGAEESSAPPG